TATGRRSLTGTAVDQPARGNAPPGAGVVDPADTLDAFRRRLAPEANVSAGDARRAIRGLDALLPKLRTSEDSIRALLYKSHAYYHLDDFATQCRILRGLRPRARGTSLEGVIEVYFGPDKCQ